jgi:hypothetical protein
LRILIRLFISIRIHKTYIIEQCSGSGIRCLFDPWNRDRGWVKNQDPDPGSEMNIPDHISESFEKTIFGLKILKFFDSDPGSGIFF